MKTFIHFSLIILVAFSSGIAQTTDNGHFCGTNFRASTPYHKTANLKTDFPKSFTTLYIPITANIVGEDNGEGHYEVENFLENLCELNAHFKEHGFHYYLENINYINNSEFYEMDPITFIKKPPMYQFIEDNNTANTLNIYIVGEAGGSNFAGFNLEEDIDFSVYPAIKSFKQSRAPVLDKDHLQIIDRVFTHEIGHYLGLNHTFAGNNDYFLMIGGTPDTIFGHIHLPTTGDSTPIYLLIERVDGVNCDISGDFICDTSPDYLGNFQCNANQESDIIQIDPVDSTFRSNGSYYMAYSNFDCRDQFTPMQVDVMRSVVEGPRDYLLYDQDPPDSSGIGNLMMIFPYDGEKVTIGGDNIVSLEWDMDGVDFYILDIGRKQSILHIPIETGILSYDNHFDFVVQDTAWEYYWIVRGVNKYFPCEMWADTSYFTINPVTVAEFESTSTLDLYPNPTGGFIYLQFTGEVEPVQLFDTEVLDLQGRSLSREIVSNNKVDVSSLARGIYILKVLTEKGVYAQKFIKD